MATRSELQALLGDILDSTSPIVQGQTRGGADGSETWVTVTNGDRVRAICFGQVTPGTCGVIQDKSGQWWAISQGQGSTQTESVQFYRHRKPPEKTKEEADVAVLLCCEKEDKYDFWITWLGDRRRNQFAYVGELPKRLQTEQYWAWESTQGGSFEFNPYRGATGGFGGGSTTPSNYDGAVIGVGPEGAFYQSEGWRGGGNGPVGNIENVADIPGGDLGGIVTPTWSRVLTDYSVRARTYLQTLCYPLDMYTDVTWEWSDGGGGYGLRKVSGDEVTVGSIKRKLGTRWEVIWSHSEGGGNVSLSQPSSPRVVSDDQERKPTYNLRLTNPDRLWASKIGFSVTEETRQKAWEPGLTWGVIDCTGTFYSAGDYLVDTNPTVALAMHGGGQGVWYTGSTPPPGPPFPFGSFVFYFWEDFCGFAPSTNGIIPRGGIVSPSAEIQIRKPDGTPWVREEKRLTVFEGDRGLYDSGWGDSVPEVEQWEDPPGESFTIRVFNEDNIEVASDAASSAISSSVEQVDRILVSFYINKDGENINGQFDASTGPLPDGFEDGDEGPEEYRYFSVGPDDEPPSVTGETRLVIARIDAWVEVAGKKLAPVTLNGQDGQAIIESPQYQEAIRPYRGPSGRFVYPCAPQKTEEPPAEETANFQAEDGFNAYHVTWYNTREESVEGKTTDYVPFDFGNPDLSGQLPSPSINYLYSLISTDLEIEYEPKGFLSWGKDLPEEGSNLGEEQEDGVDPYGVVYSLVKGFTYALYGPTKTAQSTTSKVIDAAAGETLLGNYDFLLFTFRNRQRKPRLYVLNPDKVDEGRPFEEYDISDINQRGLHQLPSTMGETFRRELWGYDLSPVANEYEEDWATERVTFAVNPSGGDTPFERQYLNDETANSSTVKQRGDKTVDITVKIVDVRALLKKTERGNVEFTIHDSQRPNETTIKTFKMNPIQDVFDGYDDVKVLAVAGVIY